MVRRRRWLVLGAAVACLLSTAGISAVVTPADAKADEPAWLVHLNEVRTSSGLAPVTEDPSRLPGILHHLTYLEDTPQQYFVGPYASWHTENPASPYYTEDGAVEAARSNLMEGGYDGVEALDGWLAAPFHAMGLLQPRLRQVALGLSGTGFAGIDVAGVDPSAPEWTGPLFFPGNGATTNLQRYAGEWPNPLETCRHMKPETNWDAAGLPLILELPEAPSSSAVAYLKLPSGRVINTAGPNVCLVNQNTYYTTDTVYGPTGAGNLAGTHANFIIWHKPLDNGTYTARFADPGKPDVSWSFNVLQDPRGTQLNTLRGKCDASGTSSLVVLGWVNRADGRGPVTYDAAVDDRHVIVPGVPDGGHGHATFAGLPPGYHHASLTGDDGTNITHSVRVPQCASFAALKVRMQRSTTDRRKVRVRIDNAANDGAISVRVKLDGTLVGKVRIPGHGASTVRLRLPRAAGAVVKVSAQDHVVATKRFR